MPGTKSNARKKTQFVPLILVSLNFVIVQKQFELLHRLLRKVFYHQLIEFLTLLPMKMDEKDGIKQPSLAKTNSRFRWKIAVLCSKIAFRDRN